VKRLCQRHRLPCKTITEAGRSKLLAHPWPGNVRELSHELERAVVFEDSDQLNFNHLLSSGGEGAPSDPRDWLNAKFAFPAQGFSLEDAINRLIQLALKQTGNNVSAAARLLGVSRDYVRYRLSGGKSTDRPGE
jgi:DNA-binding NtrC family response regulator